MQTPNTTPPTLLTLNEICEEGAAIIDWFYTDPAGDGGRDFGCDWPTMRVMYPDHCTRWDELKAEAHIRTNFGTETNSDAPPYQTFWGEVTC